MARTQLERVLDPASVAIVGASTDPTKRGHKAIKTLQEGGYEGDIYPVNPSGGEILGLEVYESVADVPAPVDLAFVVVPAHVVPSVLEDCGDADVAGAVVVAVGFGETGPEGEELEAEVVSLAREHGVRLVGPNTNGTMNLHSGLNLVGAEDVPVGSLALLTQSGNLAISLFTEAAGREGVGFSTYVGVGNEADIGFDEYLGALGDDDHTAAVVAYVEGFSDGRAFLQRARETTPETPVVVLKGGRSESGRASASSHTGSMAGDAAVADAVFAQAGVESVERSDEVLAVASALASLPAADGPNVGVLADGGGHATLAADALTDRGLSLPDLTDETRARLRAVLPDAASVANPVDVAGGTDDDQTAFFDCAAAIAADPNVDALLMTGLFGGYGIRFDPRYTPVETDVAGDIAALVDAQDLPVVVQSAYESAQPEAHAVLREAGVPVTESLDVATRSLAALARRGRHRARADAKSDFRFEDPDPDPLVSERAGTDRAALTEVEARDLLARYDVPVTPSEFAADPESAAAAADAFAGPVALKVVSPDVLHKSDVGGVALGVTDAAVAFEDVVAAVRDARPDAAVEGVLVSPMRGDAVELVVGVTRDEQFGHVAMFGIGGVFVEVFEDVSFRALPLTEADARDLVADVDAQAILDGARGGPAVDRDALVSLLLAVSRFVEANPQVDELDLNPVFATEDGVEAADAVLTLADTDE